MEYEGPNAFFYTFEHIVIFFFYFIFPASFDIQS